MIKNILIEAAKQLHGYTDTPRLDAELLMMHYLRFNRTDLIVNNSVSLSDTERRQYFELVKRRLDGEPIAYITGVKEFWGHQFKVNKEVLIPRPETELIIEKALSLIEKLPQPLRILDLGTGSGAIIVSLVDELKKRKLEFEAFAVDVSEKALSIARENAKCIGVEADITFLLGSWFSPLAVNQQFSLILSNPPYIAEGDKRVSKETFFEPRSALYAGDDGLSDIKQLIAELPRFLLKPGFFICETGYDQRELLSDLLTHSLKDQHCLEFEFYNDYASLMRGFQISSL
ncbi:MAG: peptide chain release factor N(5)-glutamine methyltransferase [Deltaproteobacteria bacterium]|nr:peptide chain release factor N(5)-glutamine methyltransferase [Deltaproteobacteria bacterium]